MAGFRFFRTPNPQKFEYKTRFFDPEKEELRERVRNAEQKGEYTSEGTKARISGSFRRKTGSYSTDREFRSSQVKRSNYRLVLIIGVLLLIGYYLISSNFSVIEALLENVSGY